MYFPIPGSPCYALEQKRTAASVRNKSTPSRTSTRDRETLRGRQSKRRPAQWPVIIPTTQSSAIPTTAVSWLHPASHRARSALRLRLLGIFALGLGQIPYLWITPADP